MKTVTTFLRSALLCAVLGVVAFGFTSQTAKAIPNVWLVPVGGCCFQVHYSLPAAEAVRWRSCQVIPPAGVISADFAVGMFLVTPPAPTVTFTHGGGGWFPVGPDIYMGNVCFTLVGPAVIQFRFTDGAGVVVIRPFAINCGLVGGGPIIVPMEGGISTDVTTTSGAGITLASSTESITDNQLADITPNPTSDNATVSLALANDMDNVSLYVADMTGRKMLDITTGERLTMGMHSFSVETQNLSSGVYYVVVKSGQFTQAKMLQVIK